MGKKDKNIFKRTLYLYLPFLILLFIAVKTFYSHIAVVRTEKYSANAWETVWPVIVSTLIAVFGTLVTSYVFLKDTLDRTIDERPYYTKVIGKYRQEKIDILMWHSGIFVGVSCYLILFQNAGETEGYTYNLFLYIGILVVVLLLISSVIFLYQCINIDGDLFRCVQDILRNYDEEIENHWNVLARKWGRFIDNYIDVRAGQGENMSQFLEIAPNNSADQKLQFDEEKFIIKFSEWEKFILAFLDKSSGFQTGQDVEQRIKIATGYIESLEIIRNVEYEDASGNGWEKVAYGVIQRYEKLLEHDYVMGVEDFLGIYQLLSDYRDALQVKMDKKPLIKSYRQEEKKQEKETKGVFYLFFLVRFYSSLRCMVTLPKIEIFYPLAKMYDVDFYNVRFENTSFRASAFAETLFVRIKMVGSNMALSRFEQCNFYNADIRDCSLANALFDRCLMSDMIWSDVDVTGTVFRKADLTESTFENAIIVNVEFHECAIHYVNFMNCKLGNVDFCDIVKSDFTHSSFAQSIMNKVDFHTDTEEGHNAGTAYTYDRNYFKDLQVEICSDGRKERKHCDIWNSLESGDDMKLNMSFSSFEEVSAEQICFHNMVLNASIFLRANMQKGLWHNVQMKGCIMSSVNLTEARLENVNMESCALADAILYKATFELVNLQNSNLTGCHASESKWTCCLLDKSDVSRIDLTKSELAYSSFRDTILTEAELTYARFIDVIFENSNGQGLLSSYSYFKDCSFTNAFLPNSNFNYTMFFYCDMSLASLAGSTITEAAFEGCNFANSNFRDCCFVQVRFKNNHNISGEIFDGCIFINCLFEGTDGKWGRIFRNNPVHYKVTGGCITQENI